MNAETPIVILCGGRSLMSAAGPTAKPLVEIGGEPIFLHVVGGYVKAGFRRFVLCTGFQGERFGPLLARRHGAVLQESNTYAVTVRGQPCEIAVVDTGEATATGGRILRVKERLVGSPSFGVSYSDTLSTVDLLDVARTHERHGRLATVTAVRLPTRFRILGLRFGDDRVRGLATRPLLQNDSISGGFFFFKRELLGPEWLGGAGDDTALEEALLEKLAAASELMAYRYEGPWQYLDAERHVPALEKIAREIAAG